MRPRSFREDRRPAVVALALTAGLALGWLPAVARAQQSPDGWSADRQAVLRSGLTIDLDFQAMPGVTAKAGSGTLVGAAASGSRRATVFADGVRSGAAAQAFQLGQDQTRTDGTWHPLGVLQLAFSGPVRNPRLHLSGLAGLATGPGGSTASALRLTVIGGAPARPALTARSPWAGWTAAGGTLAPAGADGSADGAADPAGSLELTGAFDTATFRVEQRSTAYAGSTTPPPALSQAFTLSLDEALGSAPQGYGNASHLVSDLFLGADAAGSAPAHVRGTVPLPAPPEIQPGRIEHLANDPTVSFPGRPPSGGTTTSPCRSAPARARRPWPAGSTSAGTATSTDPSAPRSTSLPARPARPSSGRSRRTSPPVTPGPACGSPAIRPNWSRPTVSRTPAKSRTRPFSSRSERPARS